MTRTISPEAIAAARLAADLTQTEAADRVGSGQSYIARIETGKTTPGGELLGKMADAYGCSVEDFYERGGQGE